MNQNMQQGGLISRAFLAGSHNHQMYFRKYARVQWTAKGGYEIQCTPQEIAAAVSHTKPYLKGKRMLSVGTETLGAERFLAENLGILEIDVVGESLPLNVQALKASGVKVDTEASPSGQYDVITVFGRADAHSVVKHCKIGTFVICLGTGKASLNPELRADWMALRKKYMAILQTGGNDFETGVGVVKVLYLEQGVNDAKDSGTKAEEETKTKNINDHIKLAGERLGSGPVSGEMGDGGGTGSDVSRETERRPDENRSGESLKPKAKGWPKGQKRGPRKVNA
jgi:hypothetical protein